MNLFYLIWYVAFAIVASIFSVKLWNIPIFNVAVDGGKLVYPFLFVLRDKIHNIYGKDKVKQIIYITTFFSLVISLLLYILGLLPPATGWTLQNAFRQLLMPVPRITIASIIAMLFSQLGSTWLNGITNKLILVDAFGIVIDSVLFAGIAFIGVVSNSLIMQIIISNIVIKFIISVVFAYVLNKLNK